MNAWKTRSHVGGAHRRRTDTVQTDKDKDANNRRCPLSESGQSLIFTQSSEAAPSLRRDGEALAFARVQQRRELPLLLAREPRENPACVHKENTASAEARRLRRRLILFLPRYY